MSDNLKKLNGMYEARQNKEKVSRVVQKQNRNGLQKCYTTKDFHRNSWLSNVIQQTPIDAQIIWQLGFQEICNYENIISQWRLHQEQRENLNPIQPIVDAWNHNDYILIRNRDLVEGIDQNKQRWANRKRGQQNLTYTENYLSDQNTVNFAIDYHTAMIGRDEQQGNDQRRRENPDSLFREMQRWQNQQQQIPFTLTAFLRITDQDWSVEANRIFLQTIIANNIKVIVAPSHINEIDQNIRSALNFNRLPDMQGTESEIRFLACYGYRKTQNNELRRTQDNNRAAGGQRNGILVNRNIRRP